MSNGKDRAISCEEIRERISDNRQESLERRGDERVKRHLAQCEECRQWIREWEETMALLQEMGLPELPKGFEEGLKKRLEGVSPSREVEGEPVSPVAASADVKKGSRTGRFAASLGIFLAGAAAALLVFWVFGGVKKESKKTDEVVVAKKAKQKPHKSLPLKDSSESMEAFEVSVLSVRVNVDQAHEAVAFRVILPYGLAFAHDTGVFPERFMSWTETLEPGENILRVPIKALLPGRWVVRVQAQNDSIQAKVEKKVLVTPSTVALKTRRSRPWLHQEVRYFL